MSMDSSTLELVLKNQFFKLKSLRLSFLLLLALEFEKDVIYMNITQNEWGFPHQNLARVYVFHKNQNKCFLQSNKAKIPANNCI